MIEGVKKMVKWQEKQKDEGKEGKEKGILRMDRDTTERRV